MSWPCGGNGTERHSFKMCFLHSSKLRHRDTPITLIQLTFKKWPRLFQAIASNEKHHLPFRGTFNASEIPTISFVSQPVGRFTDCNKK